MVTMATKSSDLQMPHGFRDAELEQVDAHHLLDGAGIELRRAADAVQVDGAAFLQTRRGSCLPMPPLPMTALTP